MPADPRRTAVLWTIREALDSDHPFVDIVLRSDMALLITDPALPDNPIVFANPAFLALTGYTEREVLGRNCRFLQGLDTDPETIAAMRAAIERREHITVELLNRRKDGTPFWNSVLISPSSTGEESFGGSSARSATSPTGGAWNRN